jgi:hypothetical protein
MINPKPIVLIPISLIVSSSPGKTKQAFAKLGVTTWQFFRHWFAWNGLVGQYRRGIINHAQFRANLKNIFPVLNNASDSQIDEAWNAMCVYTKNSTVALQVIQALVNQGVEVQIFGSSNEKHIEFITQKFFNVFESSVPLPGTCVWSHEVKENVIGNDFVAYLVKKIKTQNSSALINLFYNQPTDPAPAWLIGWFQNPFGKYMFKQADKHVKNLHVSAKNLGFELVESTTDLAEQLLGSYSSEPNNTGLELEETKRLVFRQTAASKKEEVKKTPEKQPKVPSSLRRAGICRLS